MADKKISQLTASSTPLAGTEVLPIVQSGSTVKVAVSDLTAGRSVSVSGLVAGGNPPSAGIINVVPAANGIGVAISDNVTSSMYLRPTTGGAVIGTDGGGTLRLAANGSTGSDVKLVIASTNDVTVSTGNVVMGTAGKGIDFSANGGDVLSQYDEGTYTPVFTASSSNPTVTYGLQRGKYVRVGNTVTVSVFITWSALSGGSGDLQISLPFAGESSVGAGAAGAIADLTGFTFAAGRTFCSVRPNANVLYATFPQSGSLVSTSNTTVAQTASSGLIVFSCTYLI